MSTVFSSQILYKAQQIQQQGHVVNLKLWDGLVKAWVRSGHGQLYDIYFDLKTWPETAARCRCKMSGHCEHEAACLLALANKANYKFTDPDLQLVTTPKPSFTKVKEVAFDELTWYSDIQTKKTEPGSDFFAYELGIIVDNQKINILPLILEKLKQIHHPTLESQTLIPKTVGLNLPDGKQINIPGPRFKMLMDILLASGALSNQNHSYLRLKRYQLLLMQEAEAALEVSNARWQGTELIRSALQGLINYQSNSVTLPAGLCIQLRPYQYDGLLWLQSLAQHNFSGILADDMGLGKTIQTLTHILYEKEHQRLKSACLIIAPLSLLYNWLAEAEKYTPSLRIGIYHGPRRQKMLFSNYDIILTTYGLIKRSKASLVKYKFYYLILDEAQWIKNSRTVTTQVILQLQAQHRLCLTGTPIENHLGELWSLFHFLMPGFLGTARQFIQHFKQPIETESSIQQRKLLSARIAPFLLRRTKAQVFKELPAKTYITQYIHLDGKQRDLYEAIRISMEAHIIAELKRFGLSQSRWVIINALLKLRQICCDPRLLKLPEAKKAYGSSAKLTALLELLETLMAEKRRVLIFSQFTSMLSLIEQELIQKNYAYLKLTGQINTSQERQKLIDEFQTSNIPIFLLSLKVGGFGINLTAADTVIHYDPWWNPAVEAQATDRVHRIGQTQPVFVYKLITAGTVEAVIQKMQEKKQNLVDDIFSENHIWTEENIEDFFKPLE